jgi:hypothetical protein
MENDNQLIDTPGDMLKILKAILSAAEERILDDLYSEKISLADLGLVATILQKLIDCHIALKPFGERNPSTNTISREVIDSIQTQLELL